MFLGTELQMRFTFLTDTAVVPAQCLCLLCLRFTAAFTHMSNMQFIKQSCNNQGNVCGHKKRSQKLDLAIIEKNSHLPH